MCTTQKSAILSFIYRNIEQLFVRLSDLKKFQNRLIYLFCCDICSFQLGDIADVSHELSAANIQSRFVHTVEVRRKWLIDAPNHTSHGFIVDKKCDHINEFFNCDGHGVIFKNNHFWLFIDNNPISEFTIVRMTFLRLELLIYFQ